MEMQITVRSTFGAVCLAALIALGVPGCKEDKADYISPTGLGPGPVDSDAPEDFQQTESGLKYRVRRKSDAGKPGPQDGIAMHYRAWLDDGREFENSYSAGNVIVKKMAELLPGWKEGLQHIGKGGMIEMEIPPALGFGERGLPQLQIPPNATLHVLCELLDVRHFRTEIGPTDKDAPKEFTRTGSGLQYRMLRKGSGPQPTQKSLVLVRVKGTLEDATEFENAYRTGFPIKVPMSQGMIPGVFEGMQLMNEGGMMELIVPPELGYGPQKHQTIPPNSTLKFLIELEEVEG